MEIIHVVLGKANPDRLNGVNKVVFNLATEQAKAGRAVQLWGITSNPVHDYNERIFRTKLFKAKRNPFWIDKQLRNEIKQNQHAVFHLHGGWIPVFSSLAKLFKGLGIKYVLTPHGAYNNIAMEKSYFIKQIYYRLFEKQLLKGVHKVHAIGQSEVAGMQNLNPGAKSCLLPYGFQHTPHTQSAGKHSSFTIGYVGRLDVHTKGLDVLMEAFQIFQKKVPDSGLWIIGEGSGRLFLEKFIQDNKVVNITLWGKKFGKDKDDLIRKMHVFAHPSRNEGLPNAVLEAAALGVPSVVTKATNIAEYVTAFHAGIAIEHTQTAELVSAFEQLHEAYQKGEEQLFSEGAQAMLTGVFEWSGLVSRYDELYQ